MRFPLPWLREFAPLPADDAALARAFTLSGTEVEGQEISEGETVCEFGITVNRPDCMNAYGLAREAAALGGVTMAPVAATLPAERGPEASAFATLEVADPGLCPRYRGLVITGIRVGESPAHIRKRLLQCGLRPINAVVDATNYVLLELGHPLHAFDLNTLRGKGIVVRRAFAGEKFTTLDGVERTLAPEMLVIADKERAAAIAGVMGGEATGVTAATTSILLEGAVFDPVSIRRTAKALALHTDASHRFERGVDFTGPELALERCAELILKSCGGQLAAGALEVSAVPPASPEIPLRWARVCDIAGMEIPPERGASILKNLGFGVAPGTQEGISTVTVPTWRVDVTREIDLVEEIVRVHGLEDLPALQPPLVDPVGGRAAEQRLEESLRDAFTAAGFTEAICMSLADPAVEAIAAPGVPLAALSNPMAETASVLRASLSGGLLAAAARNRARGVRQMALFEVGHVFRQGEGALQEEARVAALLFEDEPARRWGGDSLRGFLGLKGAALRILDHLGVEATFTRDSRAPFAEGHLLALERERHPLGILGTLSPEASASLGLKGQAHLLELSLAGLLSARVPRFRPFSKYPAMSRDYSILAPTAVTWEQLHSVLRSIPTEHLTAVDLVEVYEGRGLPENTRSWTVTLLFQANTRTLADDDVREVPSLVEKALKDQLGASLRAGEPHAV